MTYADLQSLFYQITKTNSTSVPVATLNLYTQPAEEKVNTLVLKNDARWEFDDGNYTDLPIATGALVSGQKDYSIAVSNLTIDRIEVLDASGHWWRLGQIDQQDLKGAKDIALPEYYSTTGRPLQYDLIANSVFLYPTPNYSLAAALKIYFTRGPLKFDYTTSKFTDGTGSTSSVPGFNSLFHHLIAYEAAYNYTAINAPSLAAGIMAICQRGEADMQEFYGLRDRDSRRRFTTSNRGNVGASSGFLGYTGGDSNK